MSKPTCAAAATFNKIVSLNVKAHGEFCLSKLVCNNARWRMTKCIIGGQRSNFGYFPYIGLVVWAACGVEPFAFLRRRLFLINVHWHAAVCSPLPFERPILIRNMCTRQNVHHVQREMPILIARRNLLMMNTRSSVPLMFFHSLLRAYLCRHHSAALGQHACAMVASDHTNS